jgi:hypothetical protein
VLPFAQYDWSKPFFPPSQISATLATNINLLTNPIPFGPFDWSARVSFLPRNPPQAQPYNPLIFSEVPFAQRDWFARPQALPHNPPQATPYNPLIFSEVPFIPGNFGGPKFGPTFAVAPQPYNVNLYSVSVAPPFALYDWSRPTKPPTTIAALQAWNPLLYTNTIPFNQLDWSTPVRIKLTVAAPAPYNISFFPAPPVVTITSNPLFIANVGKLMGNKTH